MSLRDLEETFYLINAKGMLLAKSGTGFVDQRKDAWTGTQGDVISLRAKKSWARTLVQEAVPSWAYRPAATLTREFAR